MPTTLASPSLSLSPSTASCSTQDGAWLPMRGLQVRFVRLGTTDMTALQALHADLSDAERKHLVRLRRADDRRRYLVAHAALRRMLGQQLGLGPQAVPIEIGATGKPRLSPPAAASLASSRATLHFNLSHAGDWVALAWSGLPVGIDVEQRTPLDITLLQACASAAEQSAVLSSADPQQAFLRLWTAKEAVLKAHGSGLALEMACVTLPMLQAHPGIDDDLDMIAERRWQTAQLDLSPGLRQGWRVAHWALDARHVAAVACPEPFDSHAARRADIRWLDAAALLDPDRPKNPDKPDPQRSVLS